jgi:tetratricopeptide (TPR) repeat protein
VNLPVLLLFEGFLFIVLFGGLSLLRRERLSGQFALEAIAITGVASGFTALTGFTTHPILFFILLYLITLRVRLLVDLGNFFAQRGQFSSAHRVYALAEHLWPDQTSRLIVQVNQGTARLQQGAPDEAITIINNVLQKASEGYLGIKYEAAAHYNLGVAYRRKKMEARAVSEFTAVLDIWPVSEYARRAEAALADTRNK